MTTRQNIEALQRKAAKHQARADHTRLQIVLLQEQDAAEKLQKRILKLSEYKPEDTCPCFIAEQVAEIYKENCRITSAIITADQPVNWVYLSSTARVTSAVRTRKIRDLLYEIAGISDSIVQAHGIEDWSPIDLATNDDRAIGGELGWGHAQPNVTSPYAEVECLGDMYIHER